MRQSVKRSTDNLIPGPENEAAVEARTEEKMEAVSDQDPKSRKSKAKETGQLDPLYVIFEQHLYNFQDSDSDRKTFIGNIIVEYLTYLRKMNVVVPKSLEQPIIEELAAQVNTMLVKKIYGCLSIEDYVKGRPFGEKRRAKTRYRRLTQKSKAKAAA
ncbi:MAG: hypothetical protein JNL01_04985 [Bdellovibrionales bacterium]|nr:hypothetical protein [Bdellovibrionales bacterium]